MPQALILGEYRRLLDERFRVSLPTELADGLVSEGQDCILAKELAGALSLWNAADWRSQLDAGVRLVQGKIQAGRLTGRVEEVQLLGRLLSTRHTTVRLSGRGRLVIPEAFRPFLGVEAGGDLMVVGAAVCVELWRPAAWGAFIQEHMPDFRRLFDNLSA
jgi:MraZ protein